MNTVIEPCCYTKQLSHNLEKAESGCGVSHFFSFSDWSTDELVPWVLSSVTGCEAMLCLVQMDVRTVYMIADMLRRTYHDRMENEEKFIVRHLTIIVQTSRTDPEEFRAELRTQLGRFIDQGRVTVCEDNIGFRCVVAGNGKRHLVIQGSINQSRVEPCCQMYTMTTSREAYDQAMEMLSSKRRTRNIKV